MVSKSAAYDESRDPLTKRNYLYVILIWKRCFDKLNMTNKNPREARLEQTQNVCEKEE